MKSQKLLKPFLPLFLATIVWGPAFVVAQGESNPIGSYLEQAEGYLPLNTDSAFMLARRVESLATENHLPFELACSYNLLGEIFFTEAAFNQSLEYLLNASAIFSELENSSQKANNLNLLGQVYYYIRQPESTYANHLAALQMYAALGDSSGMAATFGYLGHYFEKKGQYDSALVYQKEALDIYRRLGDWPGKVTILENLGSIYEDLEEYEQAEQYFLEAIELTDQLANDKAVVHLYNNLGDIYYKTGRYALAHELTEKSLNLSRKYTDRYQERSALRDLSQLYAAERRYQEAYQVLDSSVNLYKEIYSEEGLRQVSRLQAIFETERKSRAIELLERDRQINRLVLALVGGGLVLVVMAGTAIVSRQRLKMRKNREIFAAEQKLLQTEIESKSRALTAHTLQIIEKNKVLKNLKEELNQISQHDRKDARREIRKTTRKIDQSFYHDKDWEDFKQIFEQIHQSFFDKLHSINPELSQAELRLAALIKIRITSKDMATILGISKDSLRIGRYRLRKKLKLTKDQKLGSFIQNLG